MRVVINYDGSAGAQRAIIGLHSAGLPSDSEAHVVSLADVWPALPDSAYERPADDPDWKKSAMLRRGQSLAAEALADARRFAVEGAALVQSNFGSWKVTHAAHTGSPSLALLEPPQFASDLVVVSADGRSATARFVLGSVSQNVLRHSPCSVRISRARSKITGQPPADSDSPVRIVLGVDGSVHSALAVSVIAARFWPKGTEIKVMAALDLKFWSIFTNPGSGTWVWGHNEQHDGRIWAETCVESIAGQLRAAKLIAFPLVREGDPNRC